MNITLKAESLIDLYSKTWLSEKLDISRVTLDNRLKKSNWGKLEIEKLRKL